MEHRGGGDMPDYYYMIDESGLILPLVDVKHEKNSCDVDDIVQLLIREKKLAFKLLKGSLGTGFYKAEYNGSMFFLNGENLTYDEFVARVKLLKGYLVIEYLLPHSEFVKFCDKSVGCIRYVIGRNLSGNLQEIYSFIRFGTKKTGFVENYNAGGILAIVKNGNYEKGNILDFNTNKNVIITHHPDTGVEIKGRIPLWNEIVDAAKIIANTMPQLSYMGIDFCVTNDERVKVLEINSLTSLDCLQTDCSIFDVPGGSFFKERLEKKQNE